MIQYDRNVFIRFFIESSQLVFLVLTFASYKSAKRVADRETFYQLDELS